MKNQLFLSALTKYCLGFVLVSLLLFLPAGTFAYYGARLFLILLFVPMFLLGSVLLVKSPALLEKRLRGKEERGEQRKVVGASALIFLAGFILAGLDERFSWSTVPTWLVIAASLLFLLSYFLYAEVMRENPYLSRTVGVEETQQVITTGMYAIVRHPMYAVTVLLFLPIPLILGSWYSFAVFLFYPLILVRRIREEEAFLSQNLEGYEAYKQQVKYRLVPYIW